MSFPMHAPRTLRRWLENIDGSPGINISILNALAIKVKENPQEYTHCCLLLDAMSIKQQVQYDHHNQRFAGFVDLGGSEYSSEEAKEVLVFMVVGLKGRWKCPIAYFLTRGLQAETQAELLKHCMGKLIEIGMHIDALTLDGHSTNIAMCKLLGCDLDLSRDSFCPSFTHPEASFKTCVFLDACHMIKLVRNMLEAYGEIKSSNGSICWKFVTKLHKLQESIGLRFANKLKSSHIHFQSQKMKVSLAVQTLSHSVAMAMLSLKDLNVAEFLNCDATVEFLMIIDELFDTLNSRSIYVKGSKSAISKENWLLKKSFLLKCKQYLLSLATNDGQQYSSQDGTCILGLCTCIDSLIEVTNRVLSESHYINHILTYKLSQDHLELFFSAVRRCGGWNNNPTAIEFKSIFRRLVARSGGMELSSRGNVSLLDNTELLQASNFTYIPPSIEFHDTQYNSYIGNSAEPLVENVLTYISGWIVKKIIPQLSCNECSSSLLSQDMVNPSGNFTLTAFKNKGALMFPSEGVVKAVTLAERFLRSNINVKKATSSPNFTQMYHCVLSNIDVSCFELQQHSLDTANGIDNHYFDLLRMIGKKIRSHYNKMVLFHGQ